MRGRDVIWSLLPSPFPGAPLPTIKRSSSGDSGLEGTKKKRERKKVTSITCQTCVHFLPEETTVYHWEIGTVEQMPGKGGWTADSLCCQYGSSKKRSKDYVERETQMFHLRDDVNFVPFSSLVGAGATRNPSGGVLFSADTRRDCRRLGDSLNICHVPSNY